MGLNIRQPAQATADVDRLSVARRVLQGGLWVAGGRIVGVGLAFLINILLARTLSPGDFGTFVLLQSLIMFGGILGRCGTDVAIVRFVSEAIGRGELGLARQAIRISFRWAAIAVLPVVALGLCVLSWVAIPQQAENRGLLLLICGVSLVALTFLHLSAESHRGFDEIRLATLFSAQVSGPLLNFLFLGLVVVWAVFVDLSLTSVLSLYALSVAVVLLLAQLCLARTSAKCMSTATDGPTLTRTDVLSVGIPAAASSACAYALLQGAVWIAGTCCSQAELARFSLAIRLMQLIAVTSLIANVAVAPWIARLKFSGKTGDLQRILQRAATAAAIPALCAFVLLIAFPQEILSLLFGQNYAEAAHPLTILAAGQLMVTWTGACGPTLRLTGHQRLDMACNFGGALLLFTAGPLAAQLHGITGLATVAATAFATTHLVKWTLARRFVGVWTHATFRSADPTALFPPRLHRCARR